MALSVFDVILNAFKKFQDTKKEDCVLAKEDSFLDVSFVEVSLEELFSEEVLPTGSLFLANENAASESSRVVQEISPELSLNHSDASLALVEQGLLIKVDNSEEITSDELPAKEHRTEDEWVIILRQAISFVSKFSKRAKNFFKLIFSISLG